MACDGLFGGALNEAQHVGFCMKKIENQQ